MVSLHSKDNPKTEGNGGADIIPVLGRWKWVDPWDPRASLAYLGEFQASDIVCLKEMKERKKEER